MASSSKRKIVREVAERKKKGKWKMLEKEEATGTSVL